MPAMRTRTVRADELDKGHRLADTGRTVDTTIEDFDEARGRYSVLVFFTDSRDDDDGLRLDWWDTPVTIIAEDQP